MYVWLWYGHTSSRVSQATVDLSKQTTLSVPSCPQALTHLLDAASPWVSSPARGTRGNIPPSASERPRLVAWAWRPQRGWDTVGGGCSRGKPDPHPKARSPQQPRAGAVEQLSPWEIKKAAFLPAGVQFPQIWSATSHSVSSHSV